MGTVHCTTGVDIKKEFKQTSITYYRGLGPTRLGVLTTEKRLNKTGHSLY